MKFGADRIIKFETPSVLSLFGTNTIDKSGAGPHGFKDIADHISVKVAKTFLTVKVDSADMELVEQGSFNESRSGNLSITGGQIGSATVELGSANGFVPAGGMTKSNGGPRRENDIFKSDGSERERGVTLAFRNKGGNAVSKAGGPFTHTFTFIK